MKKLPVLSGSARRKLTADQAQFIFDCLLLDKKLRAEQGHVRRRKGLDQELATRFGVTRDAIKDIARGRSWTVLRERSYKTKRLLAFEKTTAAVRPSASRKKIG
jgi:hypothetical protein